MSDYLVCFVCKKQTYWGLKRCVNEDCGRNKYRIIKKNSPAEPKAEPKAIPKARPVQQTESKRTKHTDERTSTTQADETKQADETTKPGSPKKYYDKWDMQYFPDTYCMKFV